MPNQCKKQLSVFLRKTYVLEKSECNRLARRFYSRIRFRIGLIWAVEYALLLSWVFLVLTDRMAPFIQRVMPSASSFGPWDDIGYLVQLFVLFILVPGPTILIANLLVHQVVSRMLDVYTSNKLCYSCGYPLPACPAADGQTVVCPECGQRYRLRNLNAEPADPHRTAERSR